MKDTVCLLHKVSRFFTVLYFVFVVLFIALFGLKMDLGSLKGFLFFLMTSVSYPFAYMLPGTLITLLIYVVLRKTAVKDRVLKWIVYSVTVFVGGTTMLLLLGDYKIYSMFKFHLNGFVLNLVTTPGGIDSMGASQMDTVIVVLFVLVIYALVAWMLYGVVRSFSWLNYPFSKELKTISVIFGVVILMMITNELMFGYYSYINDPFIFSSAQNIPWYQKMRMKKFCHYLGIKKLSKDELSLKKNKSHSGIQYPLKPIVTQPVKKKYNIVWMAVESWRADALNKEITPKAWAFATTKGTYFHNHYSAGNGTKMALFGLFYGLYGSYWQSFLAAGKPPVIMQRLKELGYQFQLYTSAKFTYPEFDKTIFVNMDKKNMHQSAGRGGFKYDRQNITSMLEYIKNRDKSRPFMTFMFFESPHAPYTFPDSCIVKKDYLKTFNYSTVDIKKNITKIKNRYLNSVAHLDTQLDRVFKFLEKENLMNDTIVILSGDHGEEFLEKGHWGHNESFHEEQVRTPLVIYIPGKKRKDVYTLSSHLDVPATLAPFLGITNPAKDFSLGFNLFGKEQRKFAVIASWSDLAYVDNKVKYSFFAQRRNTLTTVNDTPLDGKDEKKLLNQKLVFEMMKNNSIFYVK